MSQCYNTTPLPLDISDSVLFSNKEDSLLSARANIGSTGWNKHAMRFPISFMRARAKLSLLREEIMHFALNTKALVSVEELLYVGTTVFLSIISCHISNPFNPLNLHSLRG